MNGELPFLNEKAAADAPAQFAIFGKHLSASDHLEDLGLTSASLAAFKRGFYVDGISECLARQAWVKDLPELETIPYDHVLLCTGPRGWLLARFKQSVDAAGRRQFPLVLVIHGTQLSGLNRITELEQLLETQSSVAAAARDAAELKQVHRQAQARAAELSQNAGTPPAFMASRQSWLASLPLGQDREGLWRICHALSPQGAGAGRARLPLHPAGPWVSALLWSSWCRSFLGDAAPLLSVLWRQGQSVADLALSPPNTRMLATLFTPEKALPLTSAVPFNVAPPLMAAAQSATAAWLGWGELFPPNEKANSASSLLNKVCNRWQGLFKS